MVFYTYMMEQLTFPIFVIHPILWLHEKVILLLFRHLAMYAFSMDFVILEAYDVSEKLPVFSLLSSRCKYILLS